jgi:antibiotic biosynthesis monooxygenase (ABM) superfamily enzyme
VPSSAGRVRPPASGATSWCVHHSPARRGCSTWIAICPSVTLIAWLFQALGLLELPLPLRTLILTVLLVPMMVYALLPLLARVFGQSHLRRCGGAR